MKEMSQIDHKQLKVVVKDLNDSGLLEKRLRIIGMSKEALTDVFVEAVERVVDDEKGTQLPESVILFYNDLVEDEAEGEESAEEETPKEEEVEEEEEAPKTTPKKKPTKKSTVPKKPAPTPKPKKEAKELPVQQKEEATTEKTKYGHGVGTQAGQIDKMLEKGATLEEIVETVGCRRSRAQNHIQHLKTVDGVTINVKDGKYRIAA